MARCAPNCLHRGRLWSCNANREAAGGWQSITGFRYTARPIWAVSSAVEHRLHTARVAGSNPAPPTRFRRSRPQAGFCRPGLRESAMNSHRPGPTRLYHNTRCSKSRGALELLQARGITPELVYYLETPPDADELRWLLGLLDASARDLLRSGDAES